jgi:hypothetical protein
VLVEQVVDGAAVQAELRGELGFPALRLQGLGAQDLGLPFRRAGAWRRPAR